MAGAFNSSDCPTTGDNSFGPAVSECVRAFDFTLVFEDSILSILPSVLLLLLGPARLISLQSKRRLIRGKDALQISKLVAIVGLIAIQIAVLPLWVSQSTDRTKTSIAAAALCVADSFIFVALSYYEHLASPRPSFLLSSYLILSILFDVVRTRTLWMTDGDLGLKVTFSISVGLKTIILMLEERNKAKYVADQEHDKCAPEASAGVLSRTTFWWLNDTLLAGFSRVLTVEDLHMIDYRLRSDHLSKSSVSQWNTAPQEGPNALLISLFSSLRWPLLAPVFPRLCLLALTLVQPLMMNTFLDYLSQPDDGTQRQKNVGYGLVGAYALVYIGIAVSTAWAQQSVYRFVTMVRGSLVAITYRRTTELSIIGLDDAAAVTLMSTDVQRAVQGFALLHEVWATFLQIAIALFLLFRVVNFIFIVPLLMFIACGVAVGAIGGQAGARQAGWMKAVEKRVGATSSMLGAIKAVKLSGLSRKMSATVTTLRLSEIASAGRYRLMLIWVVLISYIPSSFSPLILFGAYTVFASRHNIVLDSTRIFTSLALLSLITDPLTQLFHALPELLAAVACVGRIQKFLITQPRAEMRDFCQPDVLGSTLPESLGTHLTSGALGKDGQSEETVEERSVAIEVLNGTFGWNQDGDPVLRDVNLTLGATTLTMIIGKVGCGKSTLLKAILGETPLSEGRVALLSRDTSFCAQTPWLTNDTLQANITGFSDSDAWWYATVVKACALDVDIAQLPRGDQTMIGSNGITLSGGQKQRVAIARAVYSKRSIAIFDDVFSGLDTETQKHVFDAVFGGNGLLRSQRTTVILATHAVHFLPFADKVIALDEQGSIVAQGTFESLYEKDGYLSRFAIGEGTPSVLDPSIDAAEVKPLAGSTVSGVSNTVDDTTRRLGDRSVYKYYYKTIGLFNTAFFFSLLLVWVVMLKFPEIWLKWWGDSNVRHPGSDDGKYLGVYAVFQSVGLSALGLAGRHLLMVMVVTSGKRLHSSLLTTVMNAPLSFFGSTDTGAIINRFSQDIQLIDAELPIAFLNVASNVFVVVAQAIMILPASYWLALTFPFLFGALYATQKYYLRTSRQLRLLDLEAKTPLYSQFLETLGGLATIRAFSWQSHLIDLSDKRLDRSQKPFYLLYSIQRWLSLVLDLIAAALAVVVTGVAVGTRGEALRTSAGFTGVALFNIMSLSGTMKAAVNVWTLLETSIGAVARVKLFEENTPSEHLAAESCSPRDNWPERGAISFEGISASYKLDSPRSLNDISFSIKPGQKVGICGRSGSGKSSILLTLFRMLELEEGRITVDDADISKIPRETIRERLNAMPQDGFVWNATVRESCDTLGMSSDERITEVLQQTQIMNVIESKGGLDAQMTQDFLSHGQKQLFCLARSMLRRSKIIVMDEATSNVDIETDKIVQRLIRTVFKDATVIAVAHRLETILDFDLVMVIDQGRLVEMDAPNQLLAWPSAFKSLYEAYGRRTDGEEEGNVGWGK